MADDPPAARYDFLDDLDHLTGFLWQLHGLIDATVEDGRYIAEAMRAEIRQAWIQASDDLRALASYLAESAMAARGRAPATNATGGWTYEALGGRVISAPSSLPGGGDLNTLWQRLRSHGLLGPSGRMKLKGWRRRLYPFGRRMKRSWLSSALSYGGIVAGSVFEAAADSVPGKATLEFVEILADLVGKAEDG